MTGFMEGLMTGQKFQQDQATGKQQQTINSQTIESNQIKIDQQKQMMELMRDRAASRGTELADQMDWMAGIAAETGNVAVAAQLATKGASIRQKVGQLRKDSTQADYNAAGVEDRKADVPLKAARTRYYDARATALGKAGVVKTNSADLQSATDLIKRDYRNIGDEEARIQGRQVVERAKELMGRNSGLPKSEAIARAYHEQRATGVFAPFMDARPKQPRNTQYKLPSGQSLTPGMVVDGYSWTGGDPKDPSSWEKEDADEEDD